MSESDLSLKYATGNAKRTEAEFLRHEGEGIRDELESIKKFVEEHEKNIQKAIEDATRPLIENLKKKINHRSMDSIAERIKKYDDRLLLATNDGVCVAETRPTTGQTRSWQEGGPWPFVGEKAGTYAKNLASLTNNRMPNFLYCATAY